MSATLSERTRAAASSRASGMPSRRATSSATAGASRSFSTNEGLWACARSTNRRTAVERASVARSSSRRGTGSGRIGKACSPGTCSSSRLDASMCTFGAARRIAWARSADGLTRCSQLSRTSSTRCSSEMRAQGLHQGTVGFLPHAQGLCRFADHERRIADGREVEEPDAIGIFGHDFGGSLKREPRLAESAHAEQGQQPAARQPLLDLVSSRSRPMNEVACCGRLFGISRAGSQRSPLRTTR